MGKKPPGIMLYYDDLEALATMPDEQLGRLIKAIIGQTETVPPEIRFAYEFLRQKMDRDAEKYARICEQNAEKMRSRWNRSDPFADEADRLDR